MYPLQIAATSALLLTCVYLSVGTSIPVTRATDIPKVVKSRTGTEAINAKIQVEVYFKDAYGNKDVSAICSPLLRHIVLPCPQNVHGCNSMVSVSKNLNYLLHMYSHVLGFIYQSNTDEAQMGKLDYLEMIYHRFYNQMQRYLQADRYSHGDTVSIKHQDIDGKVEKLQDEVTNMTIAKAVLCHLRKMAFSAMHEVGQENAAIRGYRFCKILPVLNGTCQTH